MLLAVTRVIIATKNISRYLKNRFMFGSACIYHRANSRIDHVTYRATGIKIIEYWSNLKLMFKSNAIVFAHCQFVEITSIPWFRKIQSGIRLTKNAAWTAVFT